VTEHSIFDRMRADHRDVLARLGILEAAAGFPGGSDPAWPGTASMEVLNDLEGQFGTHMAAEDEILYPALIEALPQTRLSIESLLAEHAELRSMLGSIREALQVPAGEARNEQIAIQMHDFVDLLRIHIRREEAVVISVAERVLRPNEIRSLAARLVRGEDESVGRSPRTGPSKGAHT
jgi:hemerythrin-like domain-containing protein